MGLRRWITAEPARAVVAAFIVVFVVSAGGIALIIDHDVNDILDDRREHTEAVKVRLEVLLRSAENQLALIAGEAENFIAETKDVDQLPPDRRISFWQSRSEDGLHSFEQLSSAERGPDVGNLIAYDDARAARGGLHRTPAEVTYEARLALSMSRAFQATFRLNRSGSVYYIGETGLMYVYPWTKTRDSGFGDDLFLTDAFQFGLPEANPKRRPFWTPAYLDFAGLSLVATHGGPLYRNDKFIGVVAIDIALDEIRKFVRSERTRGTLMLADSQRRLIASSDPAVEDPARLYSLAEQIPRDIEGEILGGVSTKPSGQLTGSDDIVTFRRLDVAPWTLVEVLPLGEIYAGLATTYGPPTAAYGAILILLLLFTHRVVDRTFRQVQDANAELRVAYFTLENAAEGIIWIDPSGLIVEANRMAATVGQREPGTLHGHHVGEFMPALAAEHFPTVWDEVKAGQRELPLERTLNRADGSVVPIETTGKYISTGNREFICSFFRDITRRKLFETELRSAKDAAEEATKAKSSFLAMMSHEIRTPMNGVMSMAEMLDQTELSSDQRSMSQVIRASAQALLTIINDILDFSKIEAGKLDIEAVEFSLLDVVEGAGELIAGRADEKGLSLVVDLDPAIPDKLTGDPTRLRQILLNLMGNAVKFTEAGGVLLSIERVASPDGALRLRFEIVDTGIGLTEEQRGRLFQAFAQADTSTSRRYGGTGLGLSICRRLVDMMGGNIGVDSTPGAGSTFWLELPFAVADPAIDRPEPAIADARVLALGFDGAKRRALQRLLAGAGIAVRFAAADGDSLAEAAEATDLVILSAATDQESALEVGRALTAGGVKVALAAPRAMASTLAEADRVGLLATLTFPLRRHRLWRVIAASLGRADLDARGAVANDEAGWAPPPVEEARAAGTLILVAEDNATNRIVVSRLLSQRGYAHEMADDGAEALKKIEAGGSYGLLLTDFHMPEMDGFELTRAVRAREAASGDGSRMPIVALTADALAGTEERCLKAGMDGYLTKPIDSRLLAATLEKFLPGAQALRRRADKPAAAAAAPAKPKIDPQILDLNRLTETFGSIDADARAFLSGFATDARRMADEMQAALDAGDQAKARHHAHALKGSAFSTGAKRLGQIAADIQDCLDGDDLDSARLFAGGVPKTVDELGAAVASLLEPA